jgi:hypothetical protein
MPTIELFIRLLSICGWVLIGLAILGAILARYSARILSSRISREEEREGQ